MNVHIFVYNCVFRKKENQHSQTLSHFENESSFRNPFLGRLAHGCATLDDGTIVVAGGDTSSGRSNTVEILLDGSSSWVPSKSILYFPM